MSTNSTSNAHLHPITFNKPAVDFFSGALLGNGGLGAVVTTRPDAVVIRFGHNNVWDIRVAEDHADEIGIFAEIFERVKAIPAHYATLDEDPWYKAYCETMQENYRKPYPRPFPCGSLILGFDRRRVELLGHRLEIASGLCRVELLAEGKPVSLEIFVEMESDRLWLRLVDDNGNLVPNPFDRVRLLPDPDSMKDPSLAGTDDPEAWKAFPGDIELPATTTRFAAFEEVESHALAFRQVLPFLEKGNADHPKDRAFRLAVRVNGALERHSRINWHGVVEEQGALERSLPATDQFLACVQLDEGLASTVSMGCNGVSEVTSVNHANAAAASRQVWDAYWQRSAIALDDELLERTWYWNLYFLRCALRPGVTCPGLFANWSYRQIGVAWHGDYHMNYNTQQPFWATFSSNHVDLHLPYVDLVDHLLPISRKWASEYYGLRGAYYPHSAYPTEMNIMPYPVPTWGWEICETPWTVQSLWWHYLYTQDVTFLRQRALPPLKDAVLFLVDYMRRPEARSEQWGDNCYHIFPTVPPELYGLMPGFKFNNDCLVDLTLTKFVYKAFQQSCTILDCQSDETELLSAIDEILAHFPDYPTARSPLGEVFVSVPGEAADTIYNVPNSAMTVFPGEEHGLHSPPEEYQIAANSYRNHRTEGGNELVFLNLQGARLGLLDLERFKRQIEYCLLPNGTCTDMVLQVQGRYPDTLPFDFMAPMGIWFENFALPVVINECLLQSYNGVIRLFPNWDLQRRAEFHTLRAVGAFLVSAACELGDVQWVEIVSEAGEMLRIIVPWESGAQVNASEREFAVGSGPVEITTKQGETVRLISRLR
ncbi:MAG: hypothetical protein U0175_21230 [Caldilineaceae bacterium]